ncbi:MAG: NADPH:quinone oxidoreductase family protein [Burkholderiaceae bacterium]
MKAIVVRHFGPFAQATFDDLPDPTPGAGQVVIDVHSAEANYPDILVMEGNYQVKPPLPFSPGKAASGVVSALGAGVTSLQLGQRVAVQVEHGAYAQQLVADAGNCYPMPEGMPFDDAAALGLVYQTAHYALNERASLKPGETVLVLGASGGIGVASVQLAKALGAKIVIAGVLGADNAAVAVQAGADHVIELGDESIKENLRAQVKKITGDQGVDVVIDPVGGEANAAALRAMAWRARMVIIGFASGNIPTIKANYLLVKNIAVSGLQWSDYRERDPVGVAAVQADIFRLYEQGKTRPYISKRLPLEQFAQALGLLSNGQAQGKIILQVRESNS